MTSRNTFAELRKLAKERGLHGYAKLRKAEIIELLGPTTVSAPVRPVLMPRPSRPVPVSRPRPRPRPRPAPRPVSRPIPAPRYTGPPRLYSPLPTSRPAIHVPPTSIKSLGSFLGSDGSIPIPTPRPRPRPFRSGSDMDIFEQEEMAKTRPIVKSKLIEWRDWLTKHVPKAIKDKTTKAFKTMKDKIMGLYKKGSGEEEVKEVEEVKEENPYTPIEEAFDRSYKRFKINSDGKKRNVKVFLKQLKPIVKRLMKEVLRQKKSLKTQATLWVKWVKEDTGSTDAPRVYVDKAFNSYMEVLHSNDDISNVFDRIRNKIIEQIENPALPASGFTIDKILHMHVDFHKLKLTRGSSYLPLPKNFSGKRSVINPHNEDEECFKWAVIAALNHDKIDNHPERISNLKKFEDKCNWGGLTFPMALNKIDLFERRNPDIAVHVLTKDDIEGVYMCRKSKHLDRDETVVLFLLCEGDKRHYIAVKNLSGVLSKANSKHEHKEHYCLNCLSGFPSERKRDEHFEYCKNNDAVNIQLPKEGSTLTFTHGQYQLKAPFIMYADFEAFTKPEEIECGSSTEKVGKHIPTGFCCYSKYAHGEVLDPLKLYRGDDCVPRFVDHVVSEAKRLYNMFPQLGMQDLTDEELDGYENSTNCHICMREFGDDDIKVRDHCHFTGKFRGSAHMGCNLRYKVPNYIPVVFHNLSGYDAHLFIKELAKKYGEGGMSVIAENKEKYISFSTDVKVGEYTNKNGETKDKKIKLRFIDSFRFMSRGLGSLADNLSDDQCKNLRKFFNDEQFNIMRRKGVYPYEYVDSFDRFNETRLPSKDDFYSKLNMNGISDADYAHAQKVWKDMKVENMGVYHDIYLKTDVLLLSDVFETFRETCLKNYKLDPAHFYTAPGLAWQACLKKTDVKLDLLSDMDMLLFVEMGIRGGLCQAVHRHAKANNPYMGDMYNTSEDTTYLQYLDANNLYGWAMIQKMPTGGFEWDDSGKFTPELISELAVENGEKGYMLEVDVRYPHNLHDAHNDLPFMPERKVINGVEKLTPCLSDKRNYVIHIRALAPALNHGLVLDKVHRVLRFQPCALIKPQYPMNLIQNKTVIQSLSKRTDMNHIVPLVRKTRCQLLNTIDNLPLRHERKIVMCVMKIMWISNINLKHVPLFTVFHSQL
ncbi:uncharacterized protein LOC130649159 isoform X1 [Hydractinia symbiolongicarpus]|uniref:uncharacterized protein LOC130649159 isoform X1 n=1 Tax=Hydractinia symbiolongicarpus TaxID=13093 RepID=UPI00254B3078|nr:uncharacterized protein LOC130649159 isoform X1 [Hydractinia symbiolongicarpus]